MATPAEAGALVPTRQQIPAPLTRAAIFLVVTVNSGGDAVASVQSLCADLAALLRAVGFREPGENLSCIMGFGSEAWDRLFGEPRPAELHPFREFRAGSRHAVATPGDLLGFVDGTENPTGQEAVDATIIGEEDPAFAGGSYVVAQKYLHDMAGWNALPIEAQEHIIGRTKLSDIELDDAIKPSWAHNALTVIEENGREIDIVRDNMPFGQPGQGEFGTYFIGYSRSPRTIEQMLENMFIGRPPGNYDRILDFSRAVTGNLFFVPSATFLDEVTPDAPAASQPATESPAVEPAQPIASVSDGSLGIGSLKGDNRHE